MTLDEIKAAIAAGKRVHWVNTGYDVIKTGSGDYLIVWQKDKNAIGLTWGDGVTMNGKPEQFFIAEDAC